MTVVVVGQLLAHNPRRPAARDRFRVSFPTGHVSRHLDSERSISSRVLLLEHRSLRGLFQKDSHSMSKARRHVSKRLFHHTLSDSTRYVHSIIPRTLKSHPLSNTRRRMSNRASRAGHCAGGRLGHESPTLQNAAWPSIPTCASRTFKGKQQQQRAECVSLSSRLTRRERVALGQRPMGVSTCVSIWTLERQRSRFQSPVFGHDDGSAF